MLKLITKVFIIPILISNIIYMTPPLWLYFTDFPFGPNAFRIVLENFVMMNLSIFTVYYILYIYIHIKEKIKEAR